MLPLFAVVVVIIIIIVTVRDCQSFFGVDLPSIVLATRFAKFVDRYGNTYI